MVGQEASLETQLVLQQESFADAVPYKGGRIKVIPHSENNCEIETVLQFPNRITF